MNVNDLTREMIALGFVADGQTSEERVLIPTMRAPAYGGRGGEARTLGGRTRYALPRTDVKCTIGPRTVSLYRVHDGQVTFLGNWKTRDIKPIDLRQVLDSAKETP